MRPKRLDEVNLNEAFGFATILAALDGIKQTFAVEFTQIEVAPALFIAYFFVFRIKMYLDDSGHDFGRAGASDIVIALASWLAFLIAAAAVKVSLAVAVEWMIAALAVSTLWVLYAFFQRAEGDSKKLSWFGFVNVLHVLGLGLGLVRPGLWIPIFTALIVLVVVDARVTRRLLESAGGSRRVVTAEGARSTVSR